MIFFESIMPAREKQTEWLAGLMMAYDLPKVILGKSFKPDSNITVGSPALLLKNILEENNVEVSLYDPFIDGEPPPAFEPSVFLIGTNHEFFRVMRFPAGSVVIDTWRAIPPQAQVKIIALGADANAGR